MCALSNEALAPAESKRVHTSLNNTDHTQRVVRTSPWHAGFCVSLCTMRLLEAGVRQVRCLVFGDGDGEETAKIDPKESTTISVFNVFRCPHPPPNVAASRLDLKNGRHTSADQASYGNPRLHVSQSREFTCATKKIRRILLPGYLLGSPRGDSSLTHARSTAVLADHVEVASERVGERVNAPPRV